MVVVVVVVVVGSLDGFRRVEDFGAARQECGLGTLVTWGGVGHRIKTFSGHRLGIQNHRMTEEREKHLRVID